MDGLHRRGDPHRGQPAQVGIVDALDVLDPRRNRQLLPRGSRLVQGVEHCPVGPVADRVHGDREARRRRRTRDLGHLGGRRQDHPRAVEHPGRRRAERAVHERLDRPDPEEVGAEAGAELGRLNRPDLLGRIRHVHPQREPPVGVEPLPQAAAAIALIVVDGDDASRVRRRHRRAHRPRLLERRSLRQREVPGVALADDPRARLPGRAERSRVDPERVVVVGPERGRPVTRHRVERLRGRRPVGPAGLEPPVPAQPPLAARVAHDPERAPPSTSPRAGRARCGRGPSRGSGRARRRTPGGRSARQGRSARGPPYRSCPRAHRRRPRSCRRRRRAPAPAGGADPS